MDHARVDNVHERAYNRGMKVIGFGRSRASRALWALEEAGLEYEYQRLDPRAGDLASDWFGVLNPGRKVPVLVDGDFVLSESGAIVTYIGERATAQDLVPAPGTRDRALYDQWCFFVCTELEQPLWTAAKHRFALPREWRVPAIIDTAHKEFARAAAAAATHLGDRQHTVGDAFTMADLLLAHTLEWAHGAKLLHEPNLRAFRERMVERPAFAALREAESTS